MSNQPHLQTQDELETALTLLISVSACTDHEIFTDWHQSLQSNIQDLINTLSLLDKHSTFSQFQLKATTGFHNGLS